jgi:hypothetical protein
MAVSVDISSLAAAKWTSVQKRELNRRERRGFTVLQVLGIRWNPSKSLWTSPVQSLVGGGVEAQYKWGRQLVESFA